MILSLFMIVFSLLHQYNHPNESTVEKAIPGVENICENQLGGICVREYSCEDRIPRPSRFPNVFTCPQVFGPDRTVVCCKKESNETCQDQKGACMNNCGVGVRTPSLDCPKKGKMCCVLVQ